MSPGLATQNICEMSINSKCIAILLALLSQSFCNAQIQFIDVAPNSVIGEHVGQSYGSSWGDLNGDGLLDLYTANHYGFITASLIGTDLPFVYVNLGNDNFENETYPIDPGESADLHGGLFVDFDNVNRPHPLKVGAQGLTEFIKEVAA